MRCLCSQDACSVIPTTTWMIIALLINFHGSNAITDINAITAYDCERLENQRRIFLGDVEPCVKDDSPPWATRQVRGVVVQAGAATTLDAFSCSIKVTTNVFGCGMHSHVATPAGTFSTDHLVVGRDACKKAHAYNRLVWNDQVFEVKPNEVLRETRTIFGDRKENGYCEPASFRFKGRSYTYSTMEMTFEIILRTHTVSLKEDSVILPNSVLCPYSDLKCLDMDTEYF